MIICGLSALCLFYNVFFRYFYDSTPNCGAKKWVHRRKVALLIISIISIASVISASMWTFLLPQWPPAAGKYGCEYPPPGLLDTVDSLVDSVVENLPFQGELIIIVTSLIGSGSELLQPIFRNSQNWNYFEKSSSDPNFEIYGTFDRKAAWEEYREQPKFVKELMTGKAII